MLLNICTKYGIEAAVKYDVTKSMIMVIRSKYDRDTVFLDFVLTGAPLTICTEDLGHFLTDDSVISYMLRETCSSGNIMCITDVKTNLYKFFCSQISHQPPTPTPPHRQPQCISPT